MLYVCQEWYLYPIYVDTDERCVAFTWVQLADEHDYSESPLNGHQFCIKHNWSQEVDNQIQLQI